MDKKIALFLGLIQFIAYIPHSLSQPPANIFEGINFGELVKNIEKMIEEEEGQQAPAPIKRPAIRPARPFKAFPTKKAATKKQITKEPQPANKTTDKKTLFLESIEVNKDQTRYTFNPAKKDAYLHYMNNLVEKLKKLEKIIDASHSFSVEFIDHFAGYKHHIDQIVIAHNTITSKKLYLRAFFLPQFKDVRTKIISASSRIDGLIRDVQALSPTSQKELQRRAFERVKEVQQPTQPLPKKKRFRR